MIILFELTLKNAENFSRIFSGICSRIHVFQDLCTDAWKHDFE